MEEQNQRTYRSKVFIIFILIAIVFATAEGVYYLTKPSHSTELFVKATVFSNGKIISQPEIIINSGVEATVSQSSEDSSISIKLLAHLMKDEVLVDLDYCQGKAIHTYEASEDSAWCEQQSEQKIIVKLGEIAELPLKNGIMQLRVDRKLNYRTEEYQKLVSGFLIARH